MTFEQYQARRHMPELDGLRAISVLLVVSVHMHSPIWHRMGGSLGVTIFFVLSGYLISMLLLREENRRGSVNLTAFYIRRAFRILPLYYVVLGVYALFILGLGIGADKQTVFIKALPYYLTYLQDIPYFFHAAGPHLLPYYQSWSLGIEEKFYLIWPLIGFVALGATRRRSRIVLASGLVAALFSVSLLPYPLGSALYPYTSILTGCLLALVLEHKRSFETIVKCSTGTVVAALATLLISIQFIIPNIRSLVIERIATSAYSLVAAMLIGGLVTGRSVIKQFLSRNALVFIGKISYGIYLCHILCLNAVEKVIRSTGTPAMEVFAYFLACCLSIAVAYGMSLLVEKPLIRVGQWLSAQMLGDRSPGRAVPIAAGSTASEQLV